MLEVFRLFYLVFDVWNGWGLGIILKEKIFENFRGNKRMYIFFIRGYFV